jgi:hypothetical protein
MSCSVVWSMPTSHTPTAPWAPYICGLCKPFWLMDHGTVARIVYESHRAANTCLYQWQFTNMCISEPVLHIQSRSLTTDLPPVCECGGTRVLPRNLARHHRSKRHQTWLLGGGDKVW